MVFRSHVPELLENASAAVDALAAARAFDCNSYCLYFGSCSNTELKRLTKTSDPFWVGCGVLHHALPRFSTSATFTTFKPRHPDAQHLM